MNIVHVNASNETDNLKKNMFESRYAFRKQNGYFIILTFCTTYVSDWVLFIFLPR